MSGTKIIRLLVLAVILLAVVGIISIPRHFQSSLDAEIASTKARGEPTTPAELAGPRVSDAENAAVVYIKAGNRMPGYRNKDYKWFHTDAVLMKLTPPDWVEVKEAVARHQDVMRLLEQAASKRKCKFNRGWSQGFALQYPDWEKESQLVRFCDASALVNAKYRDADQAVHSLEMGYRVAESLGNDPATGSQIIRTSCHAKMSRSLHTCLDLGSMNERQAKTLFDSLGNVDIMRGYVRAIEGAKVIFLVGVKTMTLSDFLNESNCGSPPPPGSIAETRQNVFSAVHGKIAMKGDIACYLRALDTLHEAGKLSYPQVKKRGLLDYKSPAPFYAAITKLHKYPSYNLLRHYASQCQVSADRVFLALVAYKARYGYYPNNYVELKNRLGWKLPKDPFSGKDFIYRPKAKGFLLYSVGPNMKDDGGIQHEPLFYYLPETGDFVWKMNK